MKADDTGNKKGLLDTIYNSVKGAGSCCPPGNSCCCPASEAKSESKKKNASAEMMGESNKRLVPFQPEYSLK